MQPDEKQHHQTDTKVSGGPSGSENGDAVIGRPASTAWHHPTGEAPKVVDLVGLGPTQRNYHAALHAQYTPDLARPCEVWTLNKGIRSIACDLAFVLDDLEGECRKSSRYQEEIGEFAFHTPIITSEMDHQARQRFPMGDFHEYPLWPIVDRVGATILEHRGKTEAYQSEVRQAGLECGYYLHNSIPMILAYAWFIGVEEIRLYGIDYDWPGHSRLEADKPNAEYWVGFLRARGVRVRVPDDTTLLNTGRQPWIYGYARQPLSTN